MLQESLSSFCSDVQFDRMMTPPSACRAWGTASATLEHATGGVVIAFAEVLEDA
jgi:hypothetical protein